MILRCLLSDRSGLYSLVLWCLRCKGAVQSDALVPALTGRGHVWRSSRHALRGAFASFVSLSDRLGRHVPVPTEPFTRVHAGESWLPLCAQRCGLPAREHSQPAC